MLLWTTLCGLGHVLSSVLIGAVGIAVGWSLSSMEGFETWRGEIASTGLMGFGGLYMIYGLIQARRGHVHRHFHPDGEVHDHVHDHGLAHARAHAHAHEHQSEGDHTRSHRRTLWVIFIIFVLGPCEPLIPLLMVPAAEHSAAGVALVASVFSVATILTMLGIATAGHLGLKVVRFGAWEKYVHVLSGGAILASGLAIELLGL
jgi:ABC-type nickel/cobalt efflux system permease component RcnA